MPHTVSGKTVGDVSYGLMGLYFPRPIPLTDDQRIAAVKAAIENGCNYFNASEFYGNIEGENTLTFLRKYFDLYPEDADKVVINVKGCYGQSGPSASKEATKQSIERSLAALGPRARIAEFEPARRDPNADYLNDTLATIDTYVQSGKIGAISVSELGLETFTKVVEKYKIQSLEIELSLFRTDPITNGLLEACAKHGVTVLAYSPLGKGFLTGAFKKPEDLPEDDMRKHYPRWQGENFEKNLELVTRVEALAEKNGCTPGQVAISWLVSLNKRPGMPKIIPVAGSTKPEWIKENAKVIDLPAEDVAAIDKILASFQSQGERYPKMFMDHLDL